MLRIMETDERKVCVFFCGRFFRDLRAQMGRVSSAYAGQLVSLLIVSILFSRLGERVLHELARGGFGDIISAWIRNRVDDLGI